MAIYGYDRYGAPTVYGGVISSGVAYSNVSIAPITIQEIGEGVSTLAWTTPKNSAYTKIRLVRSSTGFPVTEDDGKNLLEVTPATPITTYTDSGLTPGFTYYYSFFINTDLTVYNSSTTYTRGYVVKDGSNNSYVSLKDGNVAHLLTDTAWWSPISVTNKWILAGTISLLMTKNYDYTDLLYQGLPRWYRGADPDWVMPAGDETSSYPELAKFLRIFGWGLDGIRTKYESILHLLDPRRSQAWYLEALAGHVGAQLEFSVSSRLQRQYLLNYVDLARGKGRIDVLVEAINAVLGWNANTALSSNMLLSEHSSDIKTPGYSEWSPYEAYLYGDRITFNSSIYTSLEDNQGPDTLPSAGASNDFWDVFDGDLDETSVFDPETGAHSKWAPTSPANTSVAIAIGTTAPGDNDKDHNALAITPRATTDYYRVTSVPNYYTPDWIQGKDYLVGELVSLLNGGKTSLYQRIYAGGSEDTDGPQGSPDKWRLYLQNYNSQTKDRKRVHEDAVLLPVDTTLSTVFYASAYFAIAPAQQGGTYAAGVTISWYSTTGGFISTSPITLSAISTAWGRVSTSDTPPAGARYAGINLVLGPATPINSVVWAKQMQFERDALTAYNKPRSVGVTVLPDRVNFIRNPSFEVDLTGWSVVGGATNTRVTTWSQAGTAAARSSVPGNSADSGISYAVNVNKNVPQIFSVYLKNTHSSAIDIYLKVSGAGLSTPAVITPINVPVNGVIRPFITFVPTSTASVTISVLRIGSSSTSGTAQQFTIDAALLENGAARSTTTLVYPTGYPDITDPDDAYGFWNDPFATWTDTYATWNDSGQNFAPTLVTTYDLDSIKIKGYFDGNINSAEYYWSGTPNNSESYYYEGLARKQYRLDRLIEDYLPFDISYTTKYSHIS